MSEGVGESDNKPAGALKEKYISSRVETRGVKRGVFWTVPKPPDPSNHGEMIRGWGKNHFQLKEATLFPQKTLINSVKRSLNSVKLNFNFQLPYVCLYFHEYCYL